MSERRKKVCLIYLGGADPEKFNSNPTVKEVAELFMELEYTPNQRLYLSVLKDMEDMQRHISEIPMFRREKIKRDVPYTISDGGEPRVVTITIDTWVDSDNSKEKLAALSSVEKIMELQERLRLKVEQESKMSKKQQRWLFDGRIK